MRRGVGGGRRRLHDATAPAEDTIKDEDYGPRSEGFRGFQAADPPGEKTMDQLTDLLEIKQRIDPKSSYIGESLPILQEFKRIEILNRSPKRPVLILGQTGAGKTETAELIHTSSSRSAKGF